jgi:hypothetical protein
MGTPFHGRRRLVATMGKWLAPGIWRRRVGMRRLMFSLDLLSQAGGELVGLTQRFRDAVAAQAL